MSWNNGKERRRFKNYLSRQSDEWRKQGMSEENIKIMENYEWDEFRKRRNFKEKFEVISLVNFNDEGIEFEITNQACICEDNFKDNPLVFGFNDSRLDKIWETLKDEKDIYIFIRLSQGKKQSEISRELKLSEKAISKRVDKMRKKFFEFGSD